MLILKPSIRMVEDKEGNKSPVIQRIDEKFSEDDLIMECLSPKDEDEDEEVDDVDTDDVDTEETEATSDDDQDWLNAL